ncbi:MAG: tetratricopeptide repeat protein [Polaribacter sp.]|uniref:tetratricopeptide repeat-containing sensor histidine kinase n=1 Tax=Polaribacter sp. TaxID=1920175 RepID=UPI0032672023
MKHKIFLIFLFFFSLTSFSQETELDQKLTFLIKNKPSSINIIDSIFKKHRKNKNYLEQIIKTSEKNNYFEGVFYAKSALGKYYRDFSFFDKALIEYNQALKIIRQLNNIENELITLNNIGSVYRRQDEIINALNYHKEALDKALGLKNIDLNIEKIISVSQNSIGNIYNSLKQYNLALEEFSKSIVVQKKVNNKLGLAINYQNIGTAHEALSNLNKALKNYSKSLDYNNQIDSKIGKIICGYSIASVLLKKGYYQKAYKTVSAILPIAIKENDKFYLSNTYNTLGLSNIYLGQFSTAKKNLNTALDIAKKHNIQTIVVKANENLAILYDKIGDHKKAYNHFKIAKEEDYKTFNAKNLIYVRDLITEYNRERAENQIKDLAKKNKISELQINRIRNLWLLATSVIVLILIITFSIYRQKTLKNEKRILSLKQDALRSQMNPHFMFNALNSIKLYIIENDKKKATSYLNKFSKLMRKILEASSIQETTLAEEIETMKLYMSIENIRFSNEIDFQIEVDSSISLQTIKIPPLVLQPFLENSLWHGLSSKKENKKIKISINKISSEFVKIEIEDNGIGRTASAKIKAEKSITRKSIGINLTVDRLINFSKNLKNDYSIIYKDLENENKYALGTKVIIKLPLF